MGKSDSQILQDRTEAIMNIVDERCSFDRANPHRFVEEYLCIPIKLFQKILLWEMMFFDNFYFLAARSLGKTWLDGMPEKQDNEDKDDVKARAEIKKIFGRGLSEDDYLFLQDQ